VRLLSEIEAVFLQRDYAVKYESVKQLEWKREDETVVITMNKNGENKRYAFKDRNYSKNFDALMQQFITRNPFKLSAADLDGLERSGNFAEIDTFLQMYMGKPIEINDLPNSIIHTDYQGFVEGWTWSISRTDISIAVNSTSSIFSLTPIRWQDVSAALTWSAVDPTIQWSNYN
jgi:hypothetical protein